MGYMIFGLKYSYISRTKVGLTCKTKCVGRIYLAGWYGPCESVTCDEFILIETNWTHHLNYLGAI